MEKSPDNLPLVTIVVPVYNGEKYLCESLDSIIRQTYPNLEILVMDDASTDGTPEIIQHYGDKVTHVRQSQNRGQFANVFDGVRKAKGEFVAVYHADDIYEPDIVRKESEFLIKYPEAGAVFCMDIFIDAEGREYNRLSLPEEVRGGKPIEYPVILNALLTYKNVFLIGPTSMVRSKVYMDVGEYREEEFHIAADLEMWIRIARKYPIGIIEEHLQRYRHDHGNLSQNYHYLRTEQEGHFAILDEHLAAGGDLIATKKAKAAHEAHRSEEYLMVSINAYIKGDMSLAKQRLANIKAINMIRSDRIQRWRLLVLLFSMRVLCVLPHSKLISNIFHTQWHK